MVLIDPELLSDAIGSIYDAAYVRSAWPTTVEKLRGLFDGSKACICKLGATDLAEYAITTDPDPTFMLSFGELSQHPNILAEAISLVPVGTVYSDHTIVGTEALRRSRFWAEWMAPQDMYGGLACKLPVPGPGLWVFDVQRGRGQDSFDANDAELLKIILPHLVRAADINQKFQSTESLTSSFSHLPFGIIVIDRHMRIATMNAAAETILLLPGSGLSSKSSHLMAADAENMAMLQRLVAQACSLREEIVPGVGGDLLIPPKRRDVGTDLALSIVPLANIAHEFALLDRYATIFIREISLELPAGFAEQTRAFFDLTTKEASLAASLASGLTLKQAARDGGIQFSTARSYLEKIFLKTRTRQQSQLVALLKSVELIGRR